MSCISTNYFRMVDFVLIIYLLWSYIKILIAYCTFDFIWPRKGVQLLVFTTPSVLSLYIYLFILHTLISSLTTFIHLFGQLFPRYSSILISPHFLSISSLFVFIKRVQTVSIDYLSFSRLRSLFLNITWYIYFLFTMANTSIWAFSFLRI